MGDEQLVAAIANSQKWREHVEFRVYRLGRDPFPKLKSGPITSATVIINGSQKITQISADCIQHALEQAMQAVRQR